MTPRWPPHRGATVAMVTRHGKEALAGPVLKGAGLTLVHVERDTDTLGTFTGTTPRAGTALDAARVKARWGLEAVPSARFALASEGSFGPHPSVPFVAGNHELVLLVDRETGLELRGEALTTETNFAAHEVASLEQAREFAARVDFPSHGLFVGQQAVSDVEALERALACGLPVLLQTDMRAHRNPMRRRTITDALERLVEALEAACPACGAPGFVGGEPRPGLPCEACATPTRLPLGVTRRCSACGLAVWLASSVQNAPAARCDDCNP